MTELASRAQLRWAFVRTVIVIVPFVLLIGGMSARLGGGNIAEIYAALAKPPGAPPAAAFSLIWSVLYVLMGIAAAIVWHAVGHPRRWPALMLFGLQLLLNFSWTPLFFGLGKIWPALIVLVAIVVVAAMTTWLFFQIRRTAGWLMVPYLAWLGVALYLNVAIGMLNPHGVPSVQSGAASGEVGLSMPAPGGSDANGQ